MEVTTIRNNFMWTDQETKPQGDRKNEEPEKVKKPEINRRTEM